MLIRVIAITALALLAGTQWYLAPLEPNSLVLQFAFSPKTFGAIIHAWPAEYLARYRAHLPFDTLLLLVYGDLGYFLSTRTALFHALPRVMRNSARWWLPMAALFDATENAFHWWLTAAPRFGVTLPYVISASCSALKWLLLFAFGLVALYAYAKAEG